MSADNSNSAPPPPAVEIPADVDESLVHEAAAAAGLDDEAGVHLLKEATKLASTDELADIGNKLALKHQLFVSRLSREAIEGLDEAGLRELARHMFALHRRVPALLRKVEFDLVKNQIIDLLYGDRPIAERFTDFVELTKGIGPVHARALASEMLHFTMPSDYWLWTHWVWEPEKIAGILKVFAEGPIEVEAGSEGEAYVKVGELVEGVAGMGGRIGIGSGAFASDVFLASSYAVYMFTVYRLRISENFNRFLPELPELARRILGVQRLGKE